MITAMVRSLLLNTSAVTALVSSRVYIDELPTDSVTLPALVVVPVTRIPDSSVGKGWTARVQVSCFSNPVAGGGSRSPAEVETVAAAVIAALHKPRLNMSPERLTIGSVSFDVTKRQVTGGTRKIVDPSGWYHVPVDVQISYREV